MEKSFLIRAKSLKDLRRRVKVYMNLIPLRSVEDRSSADPEGKKKAKNSGNGLAHVTSVKKKGYRRASSERLGRPLLLRLPSVEAMIVSSCYTRRSGVIRSEKKEREV